MNRIDNHEQDSANLDAALHTLNSIRAPEDLAERVRHRLQTKSHSYPRVSSWRPILLTPLALAVVVMACITVQRQAAPWRSAAPEAVRIQAPRRTVTISGSAAALPQRSGGRGTMPAQPRALATANSQPTVPFVYPQTREIQLRVLSTSQARITDKAVFDPRSAVEDSNQDGPN